MGEAAKPRSFCCAHVHVSMGEAAKPQSVLVLWRRRVYVGSCHAWLVLKRSRHRVHGQAAKPQSLLVLWRLWGKLQNLSLCLSSGIAVSMGEAAKPRSFCCAHVAVSMGEAAKPQSVLVLWRRGVYRGSCKTSVSFRVSSSPLASPCLWGKLQNRDRFVALTLPCLWGKLRNLSLCLSSGVSVSIGEAAKLQSRHVSGFCFSSFCFSSGVAVSMGEAAKPRSFCCAHVAVSMEEAAKPQSLLVFWRLRVYRGSCKTSVSSPVSASPLSASPLASPCLWGKLQNLVRFAALPEGMWKPISYLFWTRPSLRLCHRLFHRLSIVSWFLLFCENGQIGCEIVQICSRLGRHASWPRPCCKLSRHGWELSWNPRGCDRVVSN